MPPVTDKDIQYLEGEIGILVLVSGTLKDGRAHYAYVSIPLSNYKAFKQAEAAGHYNVANYGKILAHGEGKEPPQAVQQRMEEEYGANHCFEKDVAALMARMREAMNNSRLK